MANYKLNETDVNNNTQIATKIGAKIKVFGAGGAGNNAILGMLDACGDSVEYIGVNTDAQGLSKLVETNKIKCIQLGDRGLGAGANPQVGKEAAEAHEEELLEAIGDADMIFITAGMGGGTGTGVAPVIAKLAKSKGILTVAVVTKPFKYERRDKVADKGIAELISCVDSMITVPNQKLKSVMEKGSGLTDALKYSNEVLTSSVKGVVEIVESEGTIDVDFEDLKTVMSFNGLAVMGVGEGSGENMGKVALQSALSHPLLDDVKVANAPAVLLYLTVPTGYSMDEYEEVCDIAYDISSEDAKVIVGFGEDESLKDRVRVTVIVTGLKENDLNNTGINTSIETVKAKIADTSKHILPAKPSTQSIAHVMPTPPHVITLKPSAIVQANTENEQNIQQKQQVVNKKYSAEDLDIPTFMRNQID